MSTKSTIINTKDNEHIYFDCVNQFHTKDEKYANEISFEFDKKNIRVDSNDDDDLCFTLHKDSHMFRIFSKLFQESSKLIDSCS